MALSRSSRITLLLIIDVIFFFVELIVGYAVGSLALVADSFHMLNDVMSLVVALYAIKLTNGNSPDSRYSYGWHRAEILAALVNGVFLLALCFSISLEAMQRFFSTPEISNPKLVVIVGTFGLASNLVGLFLFHEHGHSHSHPPKKTPSSSRTPSILGSTSGESGTVTPTQKPRPVPRKESSPTRGRTAAHSPSDSFSSLYGHPAATRASLVQTAQDIAARSPSPTPRNSFSARFSLDAEPSPYHLNTSNLADISQPALSPDPIAEDTPLLDTEASQPHHHEESHDHQHQHHGHSHGSMNMRALLLHVMGDALGNVGVIATGLIIWKSDWQYKYYCDPIISLIITVIIFSSALPLVRSASFILLQGVPWNVDLDEARQAILDVEGVQGVHELHIWQLSETKLVASVHILASRAHDFMPVAVKIREVLHHQGIHSCTIQPEYFHPAPLGKRLEDSPCLVLCPADQECNPLEHACCPPTPGDV